MSNSPLPTTPKMMDKWRESIRRLKHISVFSTPITLTAGQTSFLLMNVYTILLLTTQSKFPHSHFYSDMNPEPILPWERPSFQHWKTAWLPLKKLAKKPLLYMKWLSRSWKNFSSWKVGDGFLATPTPDWRVGNHCQSHWIQEKDACPYMMCQ